MDFVRLRGSPRAITLTVLLLIVVAPTRAENVDGTNQYAWAENVGWLNVRPTTADGMQVDDFELSGYVWGENIGWIRLSCKDTSCAGVEYGVKNDGSGNLSGFAWSENAGWINFAPSTAGVTIDPATGDFSGRAWGENVGWITFAGDSPAYKVKTTWNCNSSPPLESPPILTLHDPESENDLRWSEVVGATAYDVVTGDLATLYGSGGDFGAATTQCVVDNQTGLSTTDSQQPPSGQGVWFLVRPVNCGGNGTYDASAADPRDTEIAASGNDCS